MSSPQMVADDIAAGRLIQLQVADLPPRPSVVGVVRLKGRTSSPAATAIVAQVADLLAAMPAQVSAAP